MSKKKRKAPPPSRGRASKATRADQKGHRVALAGGTIETTAVELTSREVRVHARRASAAPLVFDRSDVAAVVDLRVDGADRTGMIGPSPLRRPPANGSLLTAGGRAPVTVALVFREPQTVPNAAARRMGLKVAKGRSATVDVLELCPADTDEMLEALAGARLPRSGSVYAALAEVIGTIDDAAEAAAVSEERERAVRRNGLLSLGTFVVPVVVLVVTMFFVPADVRGQIIILLGLWIGIGIVLGTSLRRANARTTERLRPPPPSLGGPA